MSLRDELDAIYEQHGRLTPEIVREEARPADHPLHDRVFDKVPADAAEAYYLERAHQLIVSVKISYRKATGKPAEIRSWQALSSPDGGFEYRPTEEVVEDEVLTQLVLRDMEREWKQLRARYGRFKEFVQMVRGDLGEQAS